MQENQWPRLRPANNKDCKKVTELVFTILAEYNLKPDPVSTDTDIKNIEQAYFERGGTFYVLEEKDGSIIGAYGLYQIDKATCELRKMYLHRSYRGKGLGKLLLEDALSKAKQISFKRMTLETASVLTEAISLYKSYGFTEYEPEHLSSRCEFVLEIE
jgi:putative acetyltransferase